MTEEARTLHPVQTAAPYGREKATVDSAVTLRAYEVYCELYRPQPALITGECRGGFGAGELIAFLYARSFPKAEWRARFEEAMRGMRGL